MLTADMGCIYNLGVSAGLLIDHNVCHDTEAATYGAWGLYLDEGSSDGTVSNNIVYNTYAAALHLHYGSNLSIVNNVFALSEAYPCNTTGGVYCDVSSFLDDPPHPNQGVSNISFYRNIIYIGPGQNATAVLVREKYTSNSTLNDNVYWSESSDGIASRLLFNGANFSTWQRTLPYYDAKSTLADPLFVNAASFDFTDLEPTSPALALGFVPVNVTDVGPRGQWRR